jgi:hypothetical protein
MRHPWNFSETVNFAIVCSFLRCAHHRNTGTARKDATVRTEAFPAHGAL